MWHIFGNLHDVENFLKKITKIRSEEKIKKIMDTSKIKSLKYYSKIYRKTKIKTRWLQS